MHTAMRFKDFVWPNNPEQYTLELGRRLQELPLPECAGFTVQEVGRGAARLRGQGVFYGKDAMGSFLRLAQVFQQSGPGVLVHPAWQSAQAYFEELRLTQEPREDYVAYAFSFTEAAGAGIADSRAVAESGYGL